MMPIYFFPIIAIILCSICDGTAVVLQKFSADKEENVTSLDARLLWQLFQNKLYVIGVVLGLLGWILTIYAVQYLPLFLVEAVIASNIVVTIIIERLFAHRKISRNSVIAISVILIGLVLLALSAVPGKAAPIGEGLKILIILVPIPIAIAGYFLARRESHSATIGLAILGGLAFGGTSIIGRIFIFSQPIWHTAYSPQIFALLVSGFLGILLFSIALQRTHATVVNATMTSSQTLIPAIVGIVFLGDSARNGMWYLVASGFSLILAGVTFLALNHKT